MASKIFAAEKENSITIVKDNGDMSPEVLYKVSAICLPEICIEIKRNMKKWPWYICLQKTEYA